MAGGWKLRRGELKFVESVAALGAVLGLIATTGGPAPTGQCHGHARHCFGQSVVAVARPYLVHGLVGGMIAAALGALLVLVWRWRTADAPQAPRRQAIPQRVRHEVWRRDRGSCVECGSRARLEFDHIVPVSRGGSNSVRNIELRCEPCNRRKSARI